MKAAGCALAVSMLLVAAPASASALDPVAPGVPGDGRGWELVTSPEPMTARLSLGPFGSSESVLVAISSSGDRVAYKTAGPLPGASAGPFLNFGLAERGADGWSDRILPDPRPDTVSAVGSVLGVEGPLAFNADLTKSLWVNALGENESEEPDGQVFIGSPGPPYVPTVHLGYGASYSPSDIASPDLESIVFSSSRHLVPADASRIGGQSIYEADANGIHLVDVRDDGSPIDSCGSSIAGMSPDHSQVFFIPDPLCGPNDHLYLRSGGHTVDVAASQCTLADCGPESAPTFAGVTPDGSAVFLASKQRLTDADNEGREMIYRYDVGSGVLTQLYQQPPGSSATVDGRRVHSSADGTRVYFVVFGRLLPGQGSEGGANLYVKDGSGLHFVAANRGESTLVSADGRYAVFSTPESLDPRDTDSSEDVYRYDADSGQSRLLSAGTGGRGNGSFDARMRSRTPIDDDRRAVFTTAEPLLPQDENDKEDVYEWSEANGLALVSAGAPGLPGEFVGVTPDAGTILFRTSATLLPRDRDGGQLDIYAARVGGGFAEPTEPGRPSCSGSECDAGPGGGSPQASRLSRPDLGHRLELGPVGAAARRQLARTGATTLLVEAPSAGRLIVVGRDGRRPVAGGSSRASDAGPQRVRLRLTAAGRRDLARGRRLRMRLFVSLGQVRTHGPALTLKP